MAPASIGTLIESGTKSTRPSRRYHGTRRPRPLHAGEERGGRAKPVELATAVGTARQVRLDLGVLGRVERLVHQRGEKPPRLVAGHGRNRSSLSLRSMRARWSRERTVPSSRESTEAISS